MPAKRPDVVQRLKDRKGMPELQKWVYTISKVTNKGSLVFNRLLLHCLNNNIPLPDLTDQTLYLQCFNIGVGKLYKANPLLEQVWNTYFKSLPVIEKCRGDTQAYVYASKQYMTNFKNTLVFAFEGRQKKHVTRWCQENNLTKEDAYAIRCAINGWGCRKEIPEKANSFVLEQRAILGIKQDDEVTHMFLGTHMEQIVKYYYHVLKYMEVFPDAPRFTLAPISRIKNHFLTIDSTVLFEMMKNVELVKRNKVDFMGMRNDMFASVFNLKGLCSGEFTYMVETDGISLCVHFKVSKHESEAGNRELKKASERVIAIDPGRTNLIYGVEKLPSGKVQTYKLTKGEYYTAAGMKEATRKTKVWEASIHQEELIFRRHSLKSSEGAVFDAFLSDYASVYQKLWDVKTQKKWGRERLRVYSLKKKTLDRFFNTMKGEVLPTIAYGAAKFNPTSKNELSAPTTYLSKTCSHHFPLVFVDEYNTTKVCHCCNERLCPVKKEDKEVRGLRWCCSTKCRNFLNRDLNAALNILRCFESGTMRPYSLSRNYGVSKPPAKVLRVF
jgi:hypothetical protein